MILTIAIPTFNRANRLRKALAELLRLINESSSKKYVSVLVCDNGSADDTGIVLAQSSTLFEESEIPFTFKKFNQNRGFDANILSCYAESSTEYVWFLSDDDNVREGVIDTIIRDISEYAPSVIYYNFDQKPYTTADPYIKAPEFFDVVAPENLRSLKKIIAWPKLTSVVIRSAEAGLQVQDNKSWFAHVALAMQCGLSHGRILHSTEFIAFPDDDYMDNINFPPYIGNDLNIAIKQTLLLSGRMDLYDQLALSYGDPLSSSLNTLGAYYRGRFALTPSLKRELVKTVKHELKNVGINRVSDLTLHKEVIKFILSLSYGIGCGVLSKTLRVLEKIKSI